MPITTSYTRASGVLTASFEAFVASTMVAAPSGTTHFKLSLAGTAVDFETTVTKCKPRNRLITRGTTARYRL